MAGRQVQIRTRVLVWKWGSIVSQEQLGMNDEQLDAFLAAGYGIEHEDDEPVTGYVPDPAPNSAEAFPDESVFSQTGLPVKPRKRKPSGGASNR